MSTTWEVRIRCEVCLHRYRRVMRAEDEQALGSMPNPPCPLCKKAERTRGMKFSGKAPSIGGSITVRAVDQTAQIVMEDQHLSDLRSDVRIGETMAPKLAPRLQAMADNMFSRPKTRNPNAGIFGLPTNQIMRAAVGGRFNTPDTVNPVAVQHAKRDKPPIHIVAGDGVGQGARRGR